MFYGTETSLESNEDLDKDKPSLTNVPPEEIQDNTATDARQNVVDTEGDPWTGSQQVERVSHPEVQKPTTENQTSGCTNLNGGNGRCLGGCLILLLLAYFLVEPTYGFSIIDRSPKTVDSSLISNSNVTISLILLDSLTTTRTTITTTKTKNKRDYLVDHSIGSSSNIRSCS